MKREWRTRLGTPTSRPLTLESLESRRMLSAGAPWHNDALPLDVNNDGRIFPIDALNVINRLLEMGIGPLDEPSGTPQAYYDTNADGMLSPVDLVRVFNGLLQPTEITLDTLVGYTIDLTPRLEVFVADGVGVADGTAVHIDVDMNNDGVFAPAELDYTVSSMYHNRAEFALGPALPPNAGNNTYSINLRARVENSAAILTPSAVQPLIVDTQTSNALANYVNTPDDSYTWDIVYSEADPGGLYTYYVLSMTSQTWHLGDVNDPVWDHWLKVVVPSGNLVETSLLLIDGGSNTSSAPTDFRPTGENSDEEDLFLLENALATRAITVQLKGVPNESVYFFDEQPINYRTEDEIIAYTYDQYLTHLGAPGNESWPLLLPMVKSAVRAMDTIQAFSNDVSLSPVQNFIVTGFSKRGWTTWLTTAVDDRIIASIPGVIDVVNIGPSMVHQYQVLGRFSEQVQDYSDMQIFERLSTPEMQLLSRIVDPYRFFQNERMNKPKLVLNSAGDEFFMSDSSQFYFGDIPGESNYLRYFPNTGHGLDLSAITSEIAFSDAIINNRDLPKFSWTVEPNGDIRVTTDDTPVTVKMWQATNPVARDFRHGYNPSIFWSSTELPDQGQSTYVGSVPYPASGATAFFVELTFESGVPGAPHVFTTDIRVNSDLPRAPWPYTADQFALTESTLLATFPPGAPAVDAETKVDVPLFGLPTASLPWAGAVVTTVPMAETEPRPSALPTIAVSTAAWLDAEEPDGNRLVSPFKDNLEDYTDVALDELLAVLLG